MSIRLALLALLDEEPMYGYQLRQEFESSTGGTWPLNVGQVYTTLARSERDGLVEAGLEGDEAQRTYRTTADGRAEVQNWFVTPVSEHSPPRNELAIKLAMAARTPGVNVGHVIQVQRTATTLALQNFTRAREKAGKDLPWLLVADALIFAAEAEIRWLDHCETRLARASASVDRTPALSRERVSRR